MFNSADAVEVITRIDSLDTTKETGPNSSLGIVLKGLKANMCHPLKTIINLSFATGVYPASLKIAKVIPVFKKGDKLVSNYRPICQLSNISKIFEKLVYSRLNSFLELHKCIYDLQFGFRAKHFIQHTLARLTEMVKLALDQGNFVCGIFFTLQKPLTRLITPFC